MIFFTYIQITHVHTRLGDSTRVKKFRLNSEAWKSREVGSGRREGGEVVNLSVLILGEQIPAVLHNLLIDLSLNLGMLSKHIISLNIHKVGSLAVDLLLLNDGLDLQARDGILENLDLSEL